MSRGGVSDGAVIELEGLGFAYGRAGESASGLVLNVARFSVRGGERVAIVGPSGSGKTTLLHLMAGVLTARTGVARLLGEDLARLSEVQRRAMRLRHVGMVFQEFELLEYLSARENISAIARISGHIARSELDDRTQEVAQAAGIAHVLHRKPRRLSQGERQRVAVCRALVGGPRVILCDEPTGNLDPRSTRDVIELILEQAERAGAALVVVTHNHGVLDEFERVVDVSGEAVEVASSGGGAR